MSETGAHKTGTSRHIWRQHLRAALHERQTAGLYRELRRVDSASEPRVAIAGTQYLQFCTNNYLGLATDPEVVQAAQDAVAKYGAGAGASRLVAGSMALHH